MSQVARVRRVVILGAAGRDFHNFNVVFRDDPGRARSSAFTAAQIPGIAGRRYPAVAGRARATPTASRSSDEARLEALCRAARASSEVVFAYSDVAHAQVMHLALARARRRRRLRPARARRAPCCAPSGR